MENGNGGRDDGEDGIGDIECVVDDCGNSRKSAIWCRSTLWFDSDH